MDLESAKTYLQLVEEASRIGERLRRIHVQTPSRKERGIANRILKTGRRQEEDRYGLTLMKLDADMKRSLYRS